MTYGTPPPPFADRRPLWLTLGGVALAAIVLALVANALFGSGLGTPDEALRTRHPAGFSMIGPAGWGPTVYQHDSRGTDTIRFAPDRSTGRQTVLQATRFAAKPTLGPTAKATTFQGKPAFLEVAGTRYDWVWQMTFDRDGSWYHVQITSPIALDATSNPFLAFADTFRTEPVVALAPATTLPLLPATSRP